jgi:hypothetical protein
MHRERQQDVLSKDLREFHAAVFVISYLALTCVNRQITWLRTLRRRAVVQIERTTDVVPNRVQASIALQLEFDVQSAPNANLAQRTIQQFGLTLHMKWTDLPQLIRLKINLACRKVNVEVNFPQLEFLDAEKQHTPPPLLRGDENLSIAVNFPEEP